MEGRKQRQTKPRKEQKKKTEKENRKRKRARELLLSMGTEVRARACLKMHKAKQSKASRCEGVHLHRGLCYQAKTTGVDEIVLKQHAQACQSQGKIKGRGYTGKQ